MIHQGEKMTFSAKIKEELCSLPIKHLEAALAELCGMVLFANATKNTKIKLTTENRNIAHRASWLLKSLFGFDFDKKIVPAETLKKYSLIIENREKLDEIFDAFGTDPKISLRLNAAIVETDEARAAFCRGAFLTGGSVTDPESGYHLELVTSHNNLSREVISLLLELNLPAKLAVRKSNNIIYLKESGHIEDFLTRIGAPLSALDLMQTKLLKDVRNKINRKVNCEVANMSKTADAAKAQLNAIKMIREHSGLETLSPQLLEAANLRLENPELSLSELVKLTGGKIGRSGLNHRLNKLISLSDDILSRKDT
ncbi:MAG: DNA-binding protein WhiA [Oscillospiraceae bacterium]|nr:DNA-binding protein WhiA [Oscillospiraceae bacterium]